MLRGEAVQRAGDDRHAKPVPARRSLRGERPVAAGVPGHQITERIGNRLGERHGHPGRQRHPERVPQPAGILDGRPPGLAADPHLDRPPGGVQFRQPARGHARLGAALRHLFGR